MNKIHIADGLISLNILIPLWIVVIIYGVIIMRKIRDSIPEKNIPIYGVLTAMVFAFQMLNFPIMAGTSGHLLGFVLLAILTSPSMAFLMMTVILVTQAFIFADGGILALGANIFNMGIVAFIGYIFYWIIRKKMSDISNNTQNKKDENNLKSSTNNAKGLLIASFIGGFFGVLIPALVTGLEIGLSSSFPYGIDESVPAMMLYHSLIGLGEGMITMLTIGFINKYAPELIPDIKELPIWS